ncbi:hypothetical protein PVAND_015878 [Polypedilum vanderplanki]|uniref:Chitin-binding type-2 domain-containing protein n=1 Tax=Polypedilum vanderplanki TaxID=319348 RepID=A0A9J6BDF2_POLVA|nr:hypothetical protein PVAND_015878 [Polypedilum vanderplanki]
MKFEIYFVIFTIITAANSQSCSDIDGPLVTLLPHPTDCTKFYKCLAGQAYEKLCPFADRTNTTRLHFNRVLEVCDWPSKAGCI